MAIVVVVTLQSKQGELQNSLFLQNVDTIYTYIYPKKFVVVIAKIKLLLSYKKPKMIKNS